MIEAAAEGLPIFHVLFDDGFPEFYLLGKLDARHNCRERCMCAIVQRVKHSEQFAAQSFLWFVEDSLPVKNGLIHRYLHGRETVWHLARYDVWNRVFIGNEKQVEGAIVHLVGLSPTRQVSKESLFGHVRDNGID